MTFKDWFNQDNDTKELGAHIRAATDIRMSETERERTREALLSYMRIRPYRPRAIRTKRSWTALFHPVPSLAFILIIAVFGGTAAAAEGALPGDTLYPVKVSVTEPLREVLARSPEAKAEWAIDRAERRIGELNTLSVRGDVDEDTRIAAEERLDTQVHDAEETSAEVAGGSDEPDTYTERRLVALLRAHEMLLGEASAGMGGSSAEEPTLDEVLAVEATTAEPTGTSTVMAQMAMPSGAEEDGVEPASAIRARVTDTSTKRSADTSGFSEYTIKRQRKAAEQRIDALEKLLSRLDRRGERGMKKEVEEQLSAAQESLSVGDASYESDDWVDAAARFNIALRIAIDARDALTNPPLSDDKRAEGSRTNSEREDEGHPDSDNAQTETLTPKPTEDVKKKDDALRVRDVQNATTTEAENETPDEEDVRNDSRDPKPSSRFLDAFLRFGL